MGKTTLKDVALKAGVSQQAVSLVMNNKPGMVGQDTRERILKIARELNYRPNTLAQSLKKGKTNIVGITMSGRSSMRSYDNPYFSQLVSGIGEVLGKRNLKLLFHSYQTLDTDAMQTLELAESRIVDGIIVVLFSDRFEEFRDHELPRLMELDIPVVAIHSLAEQLECMAVGMDPVAAGREAAAHLLGHGYTDIAGVFLRNPRGHYAGMKEGFITALQEAGVPARIKEVERSHQNSISAMKTAAALAAEPDQPRAYFTSDDTLADALLISLRRRSYRVPDDIALLNFSHTSASNRAVSEVTAVHQPALEKGRKAAELLLEKLDDPKKESRLELIDADLYIRTSCGGAG